MAPEQLHRRDTDARTDLFAFGALLYEMVTGKRAFEGDTQAGLIGAILEREPPALSPPTLDTAVKRCLRKDPEERWQDARDLVFELNRIATDRAPTAVPLEHLPLAEPMLAVPPTQRKEWPSAIVQVACMAVFGAIIIASMCGLGASP